MDTDTRSRTITVGGDIFTVDFDAMQNMTPEQKLQQMIAAGNYDWVSPDITADKFPVEGSGIKRFRTKLFHFGRDISSEAAVAAIKKEKFVPATQVHGLVFGATFPDEQRKYPIACPGSSAQVSGFGSVVCLRMEGRSGRRELYLRREDIDWLHFQQFLGVQEVSGA